MSIIGNFKSSQDKEAKKNLQMSLLELEVSNEAEREKRQKDFKNPYKPVVVPPQIKSNAELQKDRIEQEKQAITNMAELGFDYQKGAELSAWLSSSLINKLVAFNANFKGIKKELSETTNPKLLNLDYLKNYLEKYFEDMDINYGRKFGKTEQSGTPALSTIDELQQMLPDVAQLEVLKRELGLLFGSTLEFQNGILSNIRIVDREVEDIRDNNALRDRPLTEEELKRQFIKLDKNKKALEVDLKDVIDLRNNIVKAQNLTELYIAIVPTNETLNLIKMSLTQQERADLIRRYVIVLRKLNILSNSGINELIDEVGDFAIDDYEAIKRFIRKTLQSLAFISNDGGVNQLTKLQRDYETLLQQNGKIGEIDKIKRLNDIKEAEIERARDNLRNTRLIDLNEIIAVKDSLINPYEKDVMDMAEVERESERLNQIEGAIGETKEAQRLENIIKQYERDYIAETSGLNRDNVLDAIRAEAEPYADELEFFTKIRPGQFISMNKEALKLKKKLDEEGRIALEINDIVNRIDELHDKWRDGTITPKEKAEIKYLEKLAEKKDERQFLEERRQSQYAQEMGQVLNEYGTQKTRLKKTITKEPGLLTPQIDRQNLELLRAQKRAEITDYYRELDNELDGLRAQSGAMKKNINEGIEEYINTDPKFQGMGEDIKRQRKETDDDYYTRLINRLHQNEQRFLDGLDGENIFRYIPTDISDPISYYKGKTLKKTIHGIGIREKLRKHFNEDKEYLTEQAGTAKDIKRMITKHIKDTEPIERQIADTLNGKGLNFKHTRIKVGRGITTTEQPQYKTFGKYVIHYGHLIDRNIANFKYPSLGSIPAIKPVNITDDYKDFLIDTINTGKPNERALNKLSNDEKKHFERVVIGAGLLETFNLKRGYDGDEKKDADRFILLRGEVMAGNNNEKLLKELRLLIIKLMANGRIQRNEGTNMLIELSTI